MNSVIAAMTQDNNARFPRSERLYLIIHLSGADSILSFSGLGVSFEGRKMVQREKVLIAERAKLIWKFGERKRGKISGQKLLPKTLICVFMACWEAVPVAVTTET